MTGQMAPAQNTAAGQERALGLLRRALDGGQVSHAYIFAGPAGTGKLELAFFAAKALLCEATAHNERPCGACISCRTAVSGNHPDLRVIRPDKKRSVSAEQVREAIVADAAIMPYRSARKVYIIDKADTLTHAAQNILLKTLEEPPSHGVIMLCVDAENALLPTVRSRCVTIRTALLPVSAAADYILSKRPELSRDEATFYASISGGSTGRALERSDAAEADKPLAHMAREALLSVLADAAARPAEILLKTRAFDAFKEHAELLLDVAAGLYRDIAVIASGGGALANADIAGRVTEMARGHTPETAAAAQGFVEEARRRLRHNTGFQLTIEVMTLNILCREAAAEPGRKL